MLVFLVMIDGRCESKNKYLNYQFQYYAWCKVIWHDVNICLIYINIYLSFSWTFKLYSSHPFEKFKKYHVLL